MENLFQAINELFSGKDAHRHRDQIFILDVFRIQKYHDKFELYFCNCFFGALTQEQIVDVLKIYKEGQK